MTRTLAEEIELIVKNVSNNNPAPKQCIIQDIYPDGYVDVLLSSEDVNPIVYRPCIGSPVIGEEAIICFLDGSINRGYVICIYSFDKGNLIAIINEIVLDMITLEE